MKKSKKILIAFIVIVILVVIGVLAYKYLFKADDNEVKVIKKIPAYGYNLNENETELYKTTFDELDKILSEDNVDEKEYAKCISKLFIIDFYTLNNKLSKNDIGGTDFIMESMRDNFIEEARSTFYKYLKVKDNNRNQRLPVVSKINSVTAEKTAFKYANKEVDENAYKVTISWDYEEDLGYETSAKMILVKENKKLYIVEMD